MRQTPATVLGSAEDIHDEHQAVVGTDALLRVPGAAEAVGRRYHDDDPTPPMRAATTTATVTPSLRRRLRTPGFRDAAEDGPGSHGIGGVGPWGGWPGGTGELMDDPSLMAWRCRRTPGA